MKISAQQLKEIAGASTTLMTALCEQINEICPKYGIDTPRRMAHFLAQACHETDHFRVLAEYASGKAYEGRKDLGNTEAGDGVKYKGRGIFQTTGRANYTALGVKVGNPPKFISNPKLLEQPEYAVWSACEFWKSKDFNAIADRNNTDVLKKKRKGELIDVSPVEYISLTINGGYNGMDERKKFYARAESVLK